jgi:CBS-domain-containing membrane protein
MRYTTVRDVMTTDVITVTQATPYKEILRRLAERRISAVPVVDDDGRLIGIVSRGDVLKTFLTPDEQIRRRILDDVVRVDDDLTWDVSDRELRRPLTSPLPW